MNYTLAPGQSLTELATSLAQHSPGDEVEVILEPGGRYQWALDPQYPFVVSWDRVRCAVKFVGDPNNKPEFRMPQISDPKLRPAMFAIGRFKEVTTPVGRLGFDSVDFNGEDCKTSDDQTTFFRWLKLSEGLDFSGCTFRNSAADAIKFGAGATRLRVRGCRTENCDRATVVVQSGAENVLVQDLHGHGGPILDVELTSTGAETVIVRRCTLSFRGRRPKYGIQLGGAGPNDNRLRNVLIEDVMLVGGLSMSNADDVLLRNVRTSGPLFGLRVHGGVTRVSARGCRFRGDTRGIDAQGSEHARPEDLEFALCEANGANLVSATDVSFWESDIGPVRVANDRRASPISGLYSRGGSVDWQLRPRADRPDSPISEPTIEAGWSG